MVANGQFRQDLYYRIAAFPNMLPPLRERASDIPRLVASFLQRDGAVTQRVSVNAKAMAKLQGYAWPGILRELRNVLDRGRLFAHDHIIWPEHLPDFIVSNRAAVPVASSLATNQAIEDMVTTPNYGAW